MRDARERLLARIPDLQGTPVDPTDPGWLLLEQAAWMAEVLSERLDRYPVSVMQQLLHLMGGQLNGALPAIGVLAVQPRQAGVLHVTADRPATWRFFAPQTEVRDQVEFVPMEASVPVVPVERVRVWQWDGTSLATAGSGTMVAETDAPERARHFDGETLVMDILGSDGDDVGARLTEAVATLRGGRAGWLGLEVRTQAGGTRAQLRATVRPADAFAEAAPGGFADGEPLIGRWGALDESTWTPAVRLSQHDSLPRRMRGRTLAPGAEEGLVVIHEVPPGVALSDLLEQPSAPLPSRLAEDLWRTLGRIDPRLGRLRATVQRTLSDAHDADAPWLGAAVRGARWSALVGRGPCDLLEVAVSTSARAVRVALLGGTTADAAVEAWLCSGDGTLSAESVELTPEWSMQVPTADGPVLVRVVRVPLEANTRSLVLRSPHRLTGAFANPVLAINAPVVRDGRGVTVRRAVPEPIALLEGDLVGPEERDRLLAHPMAAALGPAVAALPLARFTRLDGGDIDNFAGVRLDARAGELRLNAADTTGAIVDLKPGQELTLAWYRRCDGAAGNVDVDDVRVVEQPPSAQPSLIQVTNPLPMVGGQDREDDASARSRLFAPVEETAALPSDWERQLRAAMGVDSASWHVRAWTHTERALATTAVWPHPPEAARDLRHRLASAGPETLLICVGRDDRPPTAEELALAEVSAARVLAAARRRATRVRSVIVAPLRPLLLDGTAVGAIVPTHDTAGLTGTLRDGDGNSEPVPFDMLLLDAIVVSVGPAGRSR